MTTPRLLCLGLGYTSRALGARLQQGGRWAVTGTTRSAERAGTLQEKSGARVHVWCDAAPPPGDALENVRAVLVSAGPDAGGCPVWRGWQAILSAHSRGIMWLGYLSSSAVYGDHGGAWVDEESELRGDSARARRRLLAERQWQEFGERAGIPVVVFRLPGIYGPGRSALDSVRRGSARRVVKAGQVFSRAHVEDIAAALEASLHDPAAGAVFNVADDEPAPPQDVIAHACRLLGVTPPPEVPFETADLSEAARSFYADNKRLDNLRMKAGLGVTPRYRSYREGLAAILRQEQQQGAAPP